MDMRKLGTSLRPFGILKVLFAFIIAICSIYLLGFRQDIVYGMTQMFYNNRDRLPVKELTPGQSQLALLQLNAAQDTQSLWLVNEKYPLAEAEAAARTQPEAALQELLQAACDATGEQVFSVSEGGCSEHETGLAFDLRTKDKARRKFADSRAGKWIQENAQDYGFVIRYPFLSTHLTGQPYRPWHVRYVGKPHSLILYHNHLTLEQYIQKLKPDLFYQFGCYVVSRQKSYENTLTVLSNLKNVTVSADNTGYYVVSGELNCETMKG